MIDRSQLDRLLRSYPTLKELDRRAVDRIATESVAFRAGDGSVLFEEEDFCTAYPLIVSGSARVAKTGVSGREIVLYHVRAGEHCLLSAVGLLARRRHPARAIAEKTTSGVVLPADLFRELARSAAGFSAEVFGAVAGRVELLVRLIEQISLLNIDQRLAILLLSRGREIRATHQDLAGEIGCARENLSRALGRFQRKGIVRVGRGRVVVVDTAPLTAIAAAAAAAELPPPHSPRTSRVRLRH